MSFAIKKCIRKTDHTALVIAINGALTIINENKMIIILLKQKI